MVGKLAAEVNSLRRGCPSGSFKIRAEAARSGFQGIRLGLKYASPAIVRVFPFASEYFSRNELARMGMSLFRSRKSDNLI